MRSKYMRKIYFFLDEVLVSREWRDDVFCILLVFSFLLNLGVDDKRLCVGGGSFVEGLEALDDLDALGVDDCRFSVDFVFKSEFGDAFFVVLSVDAGAFMVRGDARRGLVVFIIFIISFLNFSLNDSSIVFREFMSPSNSA